MRVLVTIFFVAISCCSISAQFGVRVGASQFRADLNQNSYRPFGPKVGLHYWMRLKNLRIEFLPEVTYGAFKHQELSATDDAKFNWNQFGIVAHTRAYLFDLTSDCDCPTFSKQSDLFQKGFFISIAPGYFLSQPELVAMSDVIEDVKLSDYTYFGLGLGLGLDIGVSDLVTITPNASYTFYPSSISTGSPHLVNSEFNFSVTTTFRPDY